MSRKNNSNKKTGSRVQIRVQEFVKKLHPDVLRNRLRNFRKFVISATTDRRTPSDRSEPSTSNFIPTGTQLPYDCDNTKTRDLGAKLERQQFGSSETSTYDGDEKQYDNIKLKIEEMDGKICVPNVIVEKDGTDSGNDEQKTENRPSNNLQLAINVESTPRNKSPITVQEWVDSLPLTPTETSRDEDVPETSISQSTENETDNLTLGAEAGHLCATKSSAVPTPPVDVMVTNYKEPSEVESHGSSVDSLLEARKPDPEEVLLSLGFGGTASSTFLETGRIPKRFLKQSQLKGIDIEEFIRQQQDLIYTFESGYYGYRGLAGPSHSNPSVIVAKILEKLKEHERETTSMTSYQLDFRKSCSLETNSKNPTNKFSKIARNVLSTIKYTPTLGSVLTPDNRKWLDSQGSKSPEIPRRLILGQQSFTFGRDGNLIEDGDDNKTTDSTVNGESNEYQTEAKADSLKNNDLEDLDNLEEQSYLKNKFARRFTDSSTDMSVESMIMRTDWANRSDEFSFSNSEKPLFNSSEDVESVPRNSTLKRLSPIDLDESMSSLDLSDITAQSDKIWISNEVVSESDKRSVFMDSSLPECETNVMSNRVETNEDVKELSLRDELQDSGLPLNCVFNTQESSIKKLKNVLTRCSSFEESIKENSDEELNVSEERSLSECLCSEKTDQNTDSATESEFASYPHRSLINKNIHRQYEELTLLESKLHSLGRPLKVITEDQFSSISSEQRSAIQFQIIQEALKLYLNQLTADEMHLELKNCLSAEAQKVSDLLDSSSDASKLSIIVRQMTLLLQHQSQLSAQIRELSVADNKPSSCHKMCDHILKRVDELELLVQRNAQELAQMKYQLLSKNNV